MLWPPVEHMEEVGTIIDHPYSPSIRAAWEYVDDRLHDGNGYLTIDEFREYCSSYYLGKYGTNAAYAEDYHVEQCQTIEEDHPLVEHMDWHSVAEEMEASGEWVFVNPTGDNYTCLVFSGVTK